MRTIPSLLLAICLVKTVIGQHFFVDPSYGTEGISIQQEVAGLICAKPWALVPLSDGRLLGAYTVAPDTAMVSCFLPNGEHDTTFGNNGSILLGGTLGYNYRVSGMAVGGDGKIMVARTRQPSNGGDERAIQVVRLLPDGSYDTTFDGNGVSLISAPDNSNFRAMAIGPDGKLLVAGGVGQGLAMVRLTIDGQVDQTFANGGGYYVSPGGESTRVNAMKIHTNGDIYLVGFIAGGFNATGLMICKVHGDGSLDNGYANGGFFLYDHTTNFFRMESLNDCLLGPDGSLLAAGHIALDTITERFCVVKLRPDGTLDPSFSDDGILIHGTPPANARNLLHNIIYDPRGSYVLFGTYIEPNFLYRSLFLCIDQAGNILEDTNGGTFQFYETPDVGSFDRRVVFDASGRLIHAVGYCNRPIGISSLTCFVYATTVGFEGPLKEQSAVTAWPNPAIDRINIRCERPLDPNATITLIDAVGRQSRIASSGSARWANDGTLDLELPASLANGAYSVSITSTSERTVARIVVQR